MSPVVPARFRGAIKSCVTLALAVSLSACATLQAPAAPDYDASMVLARSHADAGQVDAAIAVLQQAAALDPTRKEPWLGIAGLRYRQGRAVDALSAAEQVLRRDPADAQAHELTIAAGLLVAQRTLERLRASGAAVDEAHQAAAREIAALMADVFGPEALVSDEYRQQLAREAVARYRAARLERLPEARQEEPKGDPLDLLGGD